MPQVGSHRLVDWEAVGERLSHRDRTLCTIGCAVIPAQRSSGSIKLRRPHRGVSVRLNQTTSALSKEGSSGVKVKWTSSRANRHNEDLNDTVEGFRSAADNILQGLDVDGAAVIWHLLGASMSGYTSRV